MVPGAQQRPHTAGPRVAGIDMGIRASAPPNSGHGGLSKEQPGAREAGVAVPPPTFPPPAHSPQDCRSPRDMDRSRARAHGWKVGQLGASGQEQGCISFHP